MFVWLNFGSPNFPIGKCFWILYMPFEDARAEFTILVQLKLFPVYATHIFISKIEYVEEI